jgi:hypothetical protein
MQMLGAAAITTTVTTNVLLVYLSMPHVSAASDNMQLPAQINYSTTSTASSATATAASATAATSVSGSRLPET